MINQNISFICIITIITKKYSILRLLTSLRGYLWIMFWPTWNSSEFFVTVIIQAYYLFSITLKQSFISQSNVFLTEKLSDTLSSCTYSNLLQIAAQNIHLNEVNIHSFNEISLNWSTPLQRISSFFELSSLHEGSCTWIVSAGLLTCKAACSVVDIFLFLKLVPLEMFNYFFQTCF